MRALALVAAFLLSACVFTSPAPLFGASDAAFPFENTARYRWVESGGGDAHLIQFHRDGSTYRVDEAGKHDEKDALRDVLIVAIPETNGAVFIAQMPSSNEGHEPNYAFLWRIPGGFRFVTGPDALARGATGRSRLGEFCQTNQSDDCSFASRERAFAFYRALIYPSFVATGVAPANYVDLRYLSRHPRGGWRLPVH